MGFFQKTPILILNDLETRIFLNHDYNRSWNSEEVKNFSNIQESGKIYTISTELGKKEKSELLNKIYFEIKKELHSYLNGCNKKYIDSIISKQIKENYNF